MPKGLSRFSDTSDFAVTPVITTGAYTANDAVGGLMTFTGLFKSSCSGGSKIGMVLTDKSKQSAAMNLVLFNQSFTPTADKAAIAVSVGDLANIIGVIELSSSQYTAFSANSVGIAVATIPMRSVTEDGTIFGQLHTTDTPTYAVGALQCRLVCLSDKW